MKVLDMSRGMTIALAILLALGLPTSSFADSPTATQALSGDDILARIKQAIRDSRNEYPGSYSRRNVRTRVYDSDDGELESTKEFVLDVWEFSGEPPTNKFIECKIDGKTIEPEECRDEERLDPPHDVFGEDGEKYYRLEYVGLDEWEGKSSHRIRVVPLEDTSQHVKGDLYFSKDSLNLAGMNASLASFPFGVQKLEFKMSFKEEEGGPVIASGLTVVEVYVPLFFDARFVTDFTASNQKRLKERVEENSAGERAPPPA